MNHDKGSHLQKHKIFLLHELLWFSKMQVTVCWLDVGETLFIESFHSSERFNFVLASFLVSNVAQWEMFLKQDRPQERE